MSTTDPRPQTPLDTLAAELNRTLMNGTRLPSPEDSSRRIPIAKITGHELAAPPKLSDSTSVQLVGVENGSEIVSVVRQTTALQGGFQNARSARQALGNAVTPLTTPVWTLEPKEISIGDPSDLKWLASDGTPWPVCMFGSSLLAEIARAAAASNPSPGKPKSLGTEVWRYSRAKADRLSKLSSASLPSADWRPALCFTFTARVNGERLELTGAPEAERQLLDNLYAELPESPAFDLVGVVNENSSVGGTDKITPSGVNFLPGVTIVRINLSREARPQDTALHDTTPGKGAPYQADWGSHKKEFIRLLQLAGVTNRGGYFIAGAGSFDALQGAKLMLKLALVATAPANPGGGYFAWPVWSNAAVLQPVADPIATSAWDVVRFYGSAHWQAHSTAPAGSVAFGWQVAHPDNRPLEILGEQKHNIIIGLIGDKSAVATADKTPMTMGEAKRRLRDRLSETTFAKPETAKVQDATLDSVHGFNNLAQMLDFEMSGVLRAGGTDELLFSGDETIPAPPDEKAWQEKPATAVASLLAAGAHGEQPIYHGSMPTALLKAKSTDSGEAALEDTTPSAWTNRFVQRIPPSSNTPVDYGQSPYVTLARYSAVKVTAGFRDLYGNRLSLARLAPLLIPLYYTDPLIAPGQWPGCSLLAYVDATSKKLNLAMCYVPPGGTDGQGQVSQQTKDARASVIQEVLFQLQGASNDVTVKVTADFLDMHGASKNSVELPDVISNLIDFLQRIKNGAYTTRILLQVPIPLPASPSPVNSLSRIEINLKIARNAYLPSAADMGDLALTDDGDGIKYVRTTIPFGAMSQVDQTNPQAPVTADQIGGELEAGLPAAWAVRLAYRKNVTANAEYWLVPEESLPSTTGQFFYWTIRPWSTQLGAGTFRIPQFGPPIGGDGKHFEDYPASDLTYKAQDYDALGRAAIAFLERISAEPKADTLPTLSDLLEEMDNLAPVLASTAGKNAFLVPLVAGTSASSSASDNAGYVLLDAVRSDIGAFYEVSTIMQYDLAIRTVDKSINVFYGRPKVTWHAGAPAALPSFSDFEVSNNGLTHLAFVYDLPAWQDYTNYTIQSLASSITDIQLADDVSSLKDFALGSWIKLFRPWEIPLATSTFSIPVITREFPKTPEIKTCALSPLSQPVSTTLTPSFDVRQFVAITPSVEINLFDPQSTDIVALSLQFNPDLDIQAQKLEDTPPSQWTWVSDLHVLLIMSEMNKFFYETTSDSARPQLLNNFLVLAAKACIGLRERLTANHTTMADAPLAAEPPEPINFNFLHPGPTPGYTLSSVGATGKLITRQTPRYLTPATENDRAVWSLKPSLFLVRNANVQIIPGHDTALNKVVTYQTETVSLPDFVWASVGPRPADATGSGWEVNPTDNSAVDVRLGNFLATLLGGKNRPLDFDLDIVFSHVFPLDTGNAFMTKNVLHPLTILQGQKADASAIAEVIKLELEKIAKASAPLRWVELDIKLRRHSNLKTGSVSETLLVFHERFWFRF